MPHVSLEIVSVLWYAFGIYQNVKWCGQSGGHSVLNYLLYHSVIIEYFKVSLSRFRLAIRMFPYV